MILVTGATGTVGSQLVKQLASRGAKARAMTRNPDKAADIKALGLEVVAGDMAKLETLDAAMQGVESLFLLTAADDRQVELHGNAIDAAKRAGIRHVTRLSAVGASPESTLGLARWHGESETALANSGLNYTHLRPTMFMQSFLGHAPSIKADGSIYAPMKDGKISLVDARDIAAVAVATLTEDGHHGKTYELTGPEALSFADAAAILSGAVGKPIRYVDVPPAAARQPMLDMGMPEWLVDDLLTLFVDVFAAGYGAAVSPAVAEVTKMAPTTFAQFARDHASFFKE